MKNWTENLRNVIHYGSCDDNRRSSITIYSDSAVLLSKWYRGCGFNPDTEWFDSLDQAKAAGESWANGK